jgi:hypothetical protein
MDLGNPSLGNTHLLSDAFSQTGGYKSYDSDMRKAPAVENRRSDTGRFYPNLKMLNFLT